MSEINKLPDHLGGHGNKTHLDEGTLNFVKKLFNVKTMLDIGCGPGGMIKLAREKGIEAYGIDGDFEVNRSDINSDWVTIHDYEKGPSPFNKDVDLIWSCEFVEHVYEEFLPNFMKDFQRGKIVVMTYAPPGKPGHHHVNCNTEDYWKEKFKEYGFQYDANLTRQVREVTTLGIFKLTKSGILKTKPIEKQHKAFVKHHGLCFIRM
jgi:SAM-dependent methyltransferase